MNGCVDTMDQESFDYFVIRFDHPPKKSLAKYICVPVSWTRPTDGESLDPTHSRSVYVWYPLESPRITSVRVDNREDPDRARWGMYKATVEYIGNYAGAMGWINCMKWFKKIIDHNLQMLQNSNNAEDISIEGNQSLDQQVPSTSRMYDVPETVTTGTEPVLFTPLRIKVESEESEDNGSSSPNQIHFNVNDKQRGMIALCLPAVVENLLHEIKKANMGQYRFEFGEIRYIRESDNLVVDRESNLTVKIKNEDNVDYPDDRARCINREAIPTTDTRWTPQDHNPSPTVQATSEVLRSLPRRQTVSPANINISKYTAPSGSTSRVIYTQTTPNNIAITSLKTTTENGRPQNPRKQNSQTHPVMATPNSSTAIAAMIKCLKRPWDSTSGGIGAIIQEYMSSTHCSQPHTLEPAPSCSSNLQAGDRNNHHMRPNSASNITASNSNTAHEQPRVVNRNYEVQHALNPAQTSLRTPPDTSRPNVNLESNTADSANNSIDSIGHSPQNYPQLKFTLVKKNDREHKKSRPNIIIEVD